MSLISGTFSLVFLPCNHVKHGFPALVYVLPYKAFNCVRISGLYGSHHHYVVIIALQSIFSLLEYDMPES